MGHRELGLGLAFLGQAQEVCHKQIAYRRLGLGFVISTATSAVGKLETCPYAAAENPEASESLEASASLVASVEIQVASVEAQVKELL